MSRCLFAKAFSILLCRELKAQKLLHDTDSYFSVCHGFTQHFHKQPSIDVLRKRCSENMQQIYRRTPMPKCDFNKVALLCNFIEITLRHGCSPVNLPHIFRRSFSKNTSGWLLLHFPFLVFETLLRFLLSFINCEHVATTQKAPSVSLLPPILFTSRCLPLLY